MSVYKSEKAEYLNQALKSVWDEQTLKPMEIILVEDGPLGDDLLDVIDKFNSHLDGHLKILVNEQNLGLTKSLNKGIGAVEGDYVARMDSDDISMPDRFDKQCRFLDSHPDIDVVGGSLQEFDSENQNLGVRNYPLTPDAVLSYVHKASPLAHPTVMIRRSIFDGGIKYDERYRMSQDIALWFDMLCSGCKIANLKDVTILFRRDGDVFKRRSRMKAKNEFHIYMNGIRRLHGYFSWRYIYPIARYVFRMMPVGVVKAIYNCKLRKYILQ